MINQNNLKKLALEFLDSRKNNDKTYSKKFVYSRHNNALKIIFNSSDDKLFEKLILADKKEMEKYISIYKKYLQKNKFKFKSIKDLAIEHKTNDEIQNLLTLYKYYKSFSTDWNNKIVDAVGTRTCLYCNREYIINYADQTKTKTTAELDHYYPRSLYPFLSISFFNLIPSCKTCNSKLKGDEDTFKKEKEILYPYQESLNDNTNFKLKISDTDFLNNKEKFVLNLETKNKKAKNSKKLFKLHELYQEHKDIVLELIQKAQIYNDSYIDELIQKYEGTLFKNREDLLRLITCGYVTDDDLHKRPLSKLIKDISQELGLV